MVPTPVAVHGCSRRGAPPRTMMARCIVMAVLLHCCRADAGTILGMEVNTAIMVLVIVGFVVIACLLFLLHRQCTAIKKKRRRLRLQERRRARVADDADDGEDEECASNYTAPTDVVRVHHNNAAAPLLAPSCDPGTDDAGTVLPDSPLMQPLRSSSRRSSKGPHATHSHGTPRPPTIEEEEEGIDEGTLDSSVRKVGSWLSRTLGELPPPGSPQFMTLRASSFVPQLRRSDSSDALLQHRAESSTTTAVYVRHNSRQRSQTLPSGSTLPFNNAPDPFSDIPVVDEPQRVEHGRRPASERRVERSPSQDSQASDPFQ